MTLESERARQGITSKRSNYNCQASKQNLSSSYGLTERGDFPHCAAEGPNVALGRVVLVVRAQRLLRRPPRAVDLLVGRREVRDAKAADFNGAAVGAAEEHVARAQFAMEYLKENVHAIQVTLLM